MRVVFTKNLGMLLLGILADLDGPRGLCAPGRFPGHTPELPGHRCGRSDPDRTLAPSPSRGHTVGLTGLLPGFDKDAKWPDFADRTWGGDIYRYYGYKPYWQT